LSNVKILTFGDIDFWSLQAELDEMAEEWGNTSFAEMAEEWGSAEAGPLPKIKTLT